MYLLIHGQNQTLEIYVKSTPLPLRLNVPQKRHLTFRLQNKAREAATV